MNKSVQTWPYALTLTAVQHPASPRSRSRALAVWLRSTDSLISAETATFQSYRSSPAHLSSLGNIKHLFVLSNRSGDVPSTLSDSRWSWVLPISPRTDYYCLTSVNPKTDKAQYCIVCIGVTSVG